MVAARFAGCLPRAHIRRMVPLRHRVDLACRQPAPLRQRPVRRAISDPALPPGRPRARHLPHPAGRNLRQRAQRTVPPGGPYQPWLLHGPLRHGRRAFGLHGPSRMGYPDAKRHGKALMAPGHSPAGRRHGHPRHARHGRRQHGLRRAPVRTALRLHRGRGRKLDIPAYGPPFPRHQCATGPVRRRVACVLLEIGAVAS